ncbi:MAG: MBL fold metallo-hydrolase [Candidatus Brennerbacteria bacterium]|nr:MBL fold metallo-hydrolase [Candidatus Brennerbacteria bacterium]
MFAEIASFLEKSRRRTFLVLVALIILDAFLFGVLGAEGGENGGASVSFLDVGQGDASLIELERGVQILIDGGPPNGRLLAALGEIMPPIDRTIELVVLTHPELDHYGGFIDLLTRYDVGAFLETGVTKEVDAYSTLARILEERGVRRITLRAGDRVRYAENIVTVLSPDEALAHAKEKNDTGFVLAFESDPSAGGARFLFTADIGAEVERAVAKIIDVPFDVLKVSHHGSKFSSDAQFLATVRPALAAIEVGKNSYGHPTKEALARLEAVGTKIYRTDRDGTITVRVENGRLRVFDER